MPGMPGGLVTLQQYLDANQPAVDRTQGALDQQALQPYSQALAALPGQLQTNETAGAAQAQQRAQQQADNQARARAMGAARTNPDQTGTGTAQVPYSYSLANDPNAQATLSNAKTALGGAADAAAKATADPTGRAQSLYGIYGNALSGNGMGYSANDAGFDAALTGQTKTPDIGGDISKAQSTVSPTVGGTATSTVSGQYNVDNGNDERGPVNKPRREFEVNP